MTIYTDRHGYAVPEREIILRYLDRRYRAGAEASPTLAPAIIMSASDDLPPPAAPALPARPATQMGRAV